MRLGSSRRCFHLLTALSVASVQGLVSGATVRAETPSVTIGAGGVRIQLTSASLSDAIDALAKAGAFKVTYEGARPAAMLYNTTIETPSVSRTLLRLIEGQNLNYGIVMDPAGRTVTSILILGSAARSGGAAQPAVGSPRPQPFATPPSPRNNLAPIDPEPDEETGATAPDPTPSPAAPPGPTPSFRPRLPFGRPFGPPPTPTPTTVPSP